MSTLLNWMIAQGRVTRDPELRQTGDGTSVATFTLAVERDFKTGGEKQTDFFDVVTWRQTAEFVTKYFRKGDAMIVAGRLQTRKYTGKDGSSRTVTEIVSDRVYFGGGKKTEPDADVRADGFDDLGTDDGSLPF